MCQDECVEKTKQKMKKLTDLSSLQHQAIA